MAPPRRIKVVMARGEKYLRVAYDAEALPILPHNHPLSRLLLQEAHAADHGGVESMTMRSRAHAWIVKAKKLAKSVKRGCFTCRRRAKVRETQKMAPLPEHRMGPDPVFESTVVDHGHTWRLERRPGFSRIRAHNWWQPPSRSAHGIGRKCTRRLVPEEPNGIWFLLARSTSMDRQSE